MYLSTSTKLAFLLTFSLFLNYNINAQDSFCELTSPDNVVLSEDNNSYSILSWDAKAGAIAYRVVVVDNESGTILFDQSTEQESIALGSILFTPDTYVGIACVCSGMVVGEFEYFAPEVSSNIFVQDIVMQMEGEPEPRTLECDVMRTPLLWEIFENGFTGNAQVVAPNNPVPGHQIEGAIVYVDYYEQAENSLFAQSTTVALANGSVLHADEQMNVGHNGLHYKYLTPMVQGFYGITFGGNGVFNYGIATTTPYSQAYRIEVEYRLCYNVNKVDRGEEGSSSGSGLDLTSQENDHRAATYRLERVTENMSLSVYPNPAYDQIQLSHATENLMIRNARGQVVLHMSTLAAQQAISIADWTPGIYFMETVAADGTRTAIRFVKQ